MGSVVAPREGNYTLTSQDQVILDNVADFAFDELWADGAHWPRALSRKDPIYDPFKKHIMRADWGAMGSYPGASARLIEAIAASRRVPGRAVHIYRSCADTTYVGAISQGVAADTPAMFLNNCSAAPAYNYNNGLSVPAAPYAPAWPEYETEEVYLVSPIRPIANVAGAFTDTMIRSFFGFSPTWVSASALDASANLVDASLPRHFTGRLECLSTPRGCVTLEASIAGVTVVKRDFADITKVISV